MEQQGSAAGTGAAKEQLVLRLKTHAGMRKRPMHARGRTETRKDEAKAWRDGRAMRRESTRPVKKEDERKKQHEKRRTLRGGRMGR